MEDDLNIFQMQDDLFFQMKNYLIFFQIDNLNLIQMEYDLIFLHMKDSLKRKNNVT